ncbi:MAG: MYXO-CTERM sorting domain-containing protein, partial [Myxococcota bacterium]
ETYPELDNVEPAMVSEAVAVRAAALGGPAALAEHTDERAALVVLPLEIEGQLVFERAWEVRSRTTSPPGRWVTHVDAHTGAILNVYNEVRFLDGRLSATHDTRTVNGEYSTSPVPLAYLTGATSGTRVTVGNDGAFSIDGAESWTTSLTGSYVTVRNEAGAEGSLTFTGVDPTWTTASADQAEIDSYVFLHDVRAWGMRFAPDNPQVTSPLRSNVNLDSNCNAYWDGNVNFYQAGGGCNNTGRIADVNYHEWGHGFHYYSIASERDFDGSISEGIGDAVSALLTMDPTIAPYFGTNGAAIREIDSDRSYPEDVVGEVHEDGLIFAGAVWDLYLALSETYGEATGQQGTAWAVTSQLFADAILGGPTIPESYDEFVLADDDNGDLSDGTPHLCEIIEAFGYHGLGPLGGGGALVSVTHAPLENQRAGVEIPVAGDVFNTSATCVSFELSDVEVVYSTDAGASWDSAPLGVAGDSFEGALPGQNNGTVVSYYLRATGADGTEVLAPAGGEIAPYTFFVGALEEIYCETFEDDGGYTHDLLEGTEQRGADDWAFGTPGGYSSDPDAAYSGRDVWGNDLGGGQYNGDYQAGIVNRLTSVDIDIGEASPIVVQYRRWLNVEDGVYDRARVYVNDEAVWENYETSEARGDAHTEDREWILHTVLAEPTESVVRIGWEIDSDGGLEFGGWNIDDVCVYRIGEPSGEDTGGETGNVDDQPGADTDDDGGVKIDGGCGCDSGGAGTGGLLAAAAGLLALVRRRRQG